MYLLFVQPIRSVRVFVEARFSSLLLCLARSRSSLHLQRPARGIFTRLQEERPVSNARLCAIGATLAAPLPTSQPLAFARTGARRRDWPLGGGRRRRRDYRGAGGGYYLDVRGIAKESSSSSPRRVESTSGSRCRDRVSGTELVGGA